MSRSITANVQTELDSGNVTFVWMVRLDFSGGIVAANNGVSTITWGGDDYLGVGNFGGISGVEEATDSRPYSVNLVLSGISTSLISTSLNEHYQGRDARIYLATLDADHQLIDDPVLMFRGRMDTMDITMGETATISLTVQSRMADWDKPRVRRYNHEDQILRYPTDLGFEFTPQLVEKELVWGRA